MREILIFYLSLLCIFSVLGCNEIKEQPDGEKSISITFEEEFILGASTENDSSSYENQFGLVTSIRSDQNNNIYIADEQTNQITVFSRNGKFSHTIGEEGQGPGEFRKISNFAITKDRTSIVFDELNNRITKFALDGRVLNSISTERGEFVWPFDVSQISSDRFALLYKPIGRNGYSERLWKNINSRNLHVFDHNFDTLQFSFADEDRVTVNKTGLGSAYIHTFNAGSVFSPSAHELWFAPGIYEGSIFKFTITSDSAYISEKLSGQVKADKTVDEENEGDNAIAVNMRVDGELNLFTGSINSESLGIFEMKDGKLIHFSSQLFDGVRRTVVEVFSEEGEFMGSDVLREFSASSEESNFQSGTAGGAYISEIWKDQEDRFYIADDQELPVVVRAGSINIE